VSTILLQAILVIGAVYFGIGAFVLLYETFKEFSRKT
jgi:hypothetical protein